jgi:hypothetical protein
MDRGHKSTRNHKHDVDSGRKSKRKRKDDDELQTTKGDFVDDDLMWVEKNIDMDGERVRFLFSSKTGIHRLPWFMISR